MELDDRKKVILNAIVENYIANAEPIGSRTIAKMTDLELSPATIRNCMADLEEMGLLEQPHASAGRIPSNLGYRVYVDQLMSSYRLPGAEVAKMNMLLQLKIAELDRLIKEISGIYSRFTNYPVLSTIPETKKAYIKQLQLMPIDANNALLIIVSDDNTVKDKIIHSPLPINTAELIKLSVCLTARFMNLPISDIGKVDVATLCAHIAIEPMFISEVAAFIKEAFADALVGEIKFSGAANLLDYPEYHNVDKAKQILSFLEQKANFGDIVNINGNTKIQIIIGSENKPIELHDCSLILSTYKRDGEVIGAIGVMGPTRMNYSKAVSHLDCFTNIINALIESNDEAE